MIRYFNKLINTALLVFFSLAAFSQPYKRLTSNDFRGVPNTGNGAVAYTNCSIEFSYTAKPEHDYYILTFNIKLIMNSDQSWMDRGKITSADMMAEILKHEQGHYNISFLEQQELLRTLSQIVFRHNYNQVATSVFDRIDAKYKQLNLDYDTDTQNSTNRQQQHSWDLYFEKRIANMPNR